MPHATFTNLDDSKRDAFVSAALQEFGLHGFRKASVSRLVATLGIAKGSVYQYFEGKSDLYGYLVDLAARTKLDFIAQETARSPAAGFYDLYREIVLAGARFDFARPEMSLAITGALEERSVPGLEDLPDRLFEQSMTFLRDYVVRGVQDGYVRDDVAPQLIAHFVNAATLSIVQYLERTYGFALTTLLQAPASARPFSDAELEQTVDSVMELLRQGLQPRF